MSLPLQIRNIFDRTDDQTKELFHKAVAVSISKWDVEKDTDEELIHYLYEAGLLKSTQAIKPIAKVMDDNRLYDRPENEVEKITTEVGAVFDSLSRLEGVKDQLLPVLDHFLFNSHFERIMSYMTGATFRCSPDDYPRFYNRLLEVDTNLGGFFALDYITTKFLSSITNEKVLAHLGELSPEAKDLLQQTMRNNH